MRGMIPDKYSLQSMSTNSGNVLVAPTVVAGLSTLLPATIAFAHQDLVVAIALYPVRLQRNAGLMQRKDAYRSAGLSRIG